MISIKVPGQVIKQIIRDDREPHYTFFKFPSNLAFEARRMLSLPGPVMQQEHNLDIICSAASYFDTTTAEPTEGFNKARNALLALCDLLEQIADSIPGNVNHRICSRLTRELMPCICSIHRFEEETLYPLAQTQKEKPSQIEVTIERLKHEHLEDRCFAEELTEALRGLSQDQIPENPDALGYMLRGFFESMRRHVAFETEHLRPYL